MLVLILVFNIGKGNEKLYFSVMEKNYYLQIFKLMFHSLSVNHERFCSL